MPADPVGAGQYTLELARELDRRDDVDLVVVSRRRRCRPLAVDGPRRRGWWPSPPAAGPSGWRGSRPGCPAGCCAAGGGRPPRPPLHDARAHPGALPWSPSTTSASSRLPSGTSARRWCCSGGRSPWRPAGRGPWSSRAGRPPRSWPGGARWPPRWSSPTTGWTSSGSGRPSRRRARTPPPSPPSIPGWPTARRTCSSSAPSSPARTCPPWCGPSRAVAGRRPEARLVLAGGAGWGAEAVGRAVGATRAG